MALRYCGLVVAALWVGGLSVGVCAVGAEFERDVQPLLEQFCVDCHGPQKQKSDVRLDTLNRDFISGPHAEDWHDVLDVLNRGEMPPEDEKQMTSAERQVIVDWITGQLTHAAEVKRSTGGRGVLRRLTRYEYNQTMKDLLGVDLNYANDLPPEARSSDGFKNNGSSMGMSALQLEYYLAAARMGLSKALVEGEAPKRIRHVTTENQTRNVNKPLKQPHTKNIQPGSSFLARMMEYPEEGPVRVRVKVGVKLPEGASVAGVVGVAPRMRVAMGVRADTENPESLMGEEVDVVEVDGEVGVYEFVGRMENFPLPNKVSGKYPGLLVNVYNVYDDGSGALDKMYLKLNQQEKFLNKPDETQPWLVIESVEFIGSDYEYWPPKHHQAILFEGDGSGGDETGYARRVLERFMGRAFRRPAHADEVDLMLGYFERVRGGDTFVEAMRETLAMVLVSPEFLYLLEPVDGEGARPLTGYEVASRLSYFLWSTMPDDQLIKLAGDGGLLKKRTLAKQVSRMLADDRSQRFENHFADQ